MDALKIAQQDFGLTSSQAAFVVAYIENGGNAAAAARTAYRTERDGRTLGHKVLSSPRVKHAIRELTVAGAVGFGLPVINVLMGIATDAEQPAGARVQAAGKLLEIGGYIGPASRRDDASAASDKPLSEMTVDELERAALEQRARLESALKAVEDLRAEAHAQAGAITIDAQPVRVPDGSGPWD